MKYFKKNLFYLLVLIFGFSTFMSGCEFFDEIKNEINISGMVTYNDSALEGVVLKSKIQSYGRSDDNGNFTFTAKATSLTIYAEKTGYTFTPSSYTFTNDSNNVVFIAQLEKELIGTISLSKIEITPTSILNLRETYTYSQNNNECLKIKSFNVKYNDSEYQNCLENSPTFAIKNNKNIYNFSYVSSFSIGTKFNLGFSLDAFFIYYGTEYSYNEDKWNYINIPANFTTGDLDENRNLIFSYIGVNSTNGSFSYNVSFVFNYSESKV